MTVLGYGSVGGRILAATSVFWLDAHDVDSVLSVYSISEYSRLLAQRLSSLRTAERTQDWIHRVFYSRGRRATSRVFVEFRLLHFFSRWTGA